jgi:hypothetical protein
MTELQGTVTCKENVEIFPNNLENNDFNNPSSILNR